MRGIQGLGILFSIVTALVLRAAPATTVLEGAGSVQQQCIPPPAGVVGWWSGDGHADDLSGNNLHGAIVGSGVGYAQGKVGQAFRFDNQDGRVLVAHSAQFDPASALTIEAWVQPWTPALENLGQVLDHAGAIGIGGGYEMGMRGYFGDTAYGVVAISHGAGAGTNWDALGGPAMPVNAWYHVVGAYDAAGLTYRLYINGQDIYGPGRDLSSPDSINYYEQLDLSIGNALLPRGGIDRGFYGLIDEVRVYNRALTAGEVLAIYQADQAGVCKTIPVSIDIKPGDPTNSYKCGVAGVITVAIVTTRTSDGDAVDFDATMVDPLTVRFGRSGNEASEVHQRGHLQDVDRDGDLDLVLHFAVEQTGLDCTDQAGALTGRTIDGRSFSGSDLLNPVRR